MLKTLPTYVKLASSACQKIFDTAEYYMCLNVCLDLIFSPFLTNFIFSFMTKLLFPITINNKSNNTLKYVSQSRALVNINDSTICSECFLCFSRLTLARTRSKAVYERINSDHNHLTVKVMPKSV